jgi:hypothetical protein
VSVSSDKAARPAHEDRLAFHRQLSAEKVCVAFDGSDSEIAATAVEADEAIPMREIALDKRFVPFLCMADIADREVEVVSSRRHGCPDRPS